MSWHGPSAPRVEGIATKSLWWQAGHRSRHRRHRGFLLLSVAFMRRFSCCLPPRKGRAATIKTYFAGIYRSVIGKNKSRFLPDITTTRIVRLDRFQNRARSHTLHATRAPRRYRDARQSQWLVPHHRRSDRRGGRARLQSYQAKKQPEGLQINVGPNGLKIQDK